MDESDLLKSKIRVKKVHFDGVKRTNISILAKIIKPIYEAQTVEECFQKIETATDKLRLLDTFSKIVHALEFPKYGKKTSLENDSIKDIELIFNVEERNRIHCGIESTVDDRRTAYVSLNLNLPNLTGSGDSIRTDLRMCNDKSFGEVNYSRLYAPWWDMCSPKHTTTIYTSDSNSTSSGYNQKDKGISSRVDMNIAKNLSHSVNFDGVWRDIRCSEFDTPFEIRKQSGHSFKTSAKYTIRHDTRDKPTFSTSGYMLRMSLEHAGLFKLGDINFTKSDIDVQINKPIYQKLGMSCQGNLQLGLIQPHPGNYLICDKYFAGGPLTVRGFKQNGIGPHSEKYALGTRGFWAAGAHIYSCLPCVSPKSFLSDIIRPHLFVNAGSAVDFGITKNLDTNFKNLTSQARMSYGFGLVIYLRSIRLELNYCVPKRFHKGDQIEAGSQFGFGAFFND